MKPHWSRRRFLHTLGAASTIPVFGIIGCHTTTSSTSTKPDRTYHIDPDNGNDNNDGLSSSHPFKSYTTRKFVGGDTVLFRRGCVIRDMLHTCNGAEGAPILYGAYGKGPKPAFLGSVRLGDSSRWVEERPSVWRYAETMPSEVCNLVFDDGASCGTLRWQLDDLRQTGDWYYSGFGKQHVGGDILYLYAPSNPGAAYKKIECVLWGFRKLAGGESNIILDNLSFQNSGVHGYQDFHPHNITIRNCDFRFIGGAVWNQEGRIRFGNAIELWDGARDVLVEGCLFDNIYDSGVTHQGGGTRNIPERLFFRDNLFIENGLVAYESREPAREVYFEYNTCVNAGGGFSMQGERPPRRSDPYPQPLGYHVWAWMIEPRTQPGNVYIRHNIMCDGYGPAVCLSIDPSDAEKFKLDNNCYWQTKSDRLVQWSDRVYTTSDFARYQAECLRDQHSRIAKPRFAENLHGDLRQGITSPCRNTGMRIDVRRK